MVLTVNASKKYDIVIKKSWDELPATVAKVAKGENIVIVSDDNVAPIYLHEVVSILRDYNVITHVIKAGELSKNLIEYTQLMEKLAYSNIRRDDTIIALGGGVVGDLTAFVASTYMRGISLIALPTTLLAMIDSSVGGKTAVNLGIGKNLCGTFYQPDGVFINVDTLATLPKSEVDCGRGELVKYALLDSRVTAEDIDRYYLPEVIYKCVSIKKEIVEKDEFDQGQRMLLNLGHTVGHAIEALHEYVFPHGVCVLVGLYEIARISKKIFGDEEEYHKIISLLRRVDTYLPDKYDLEDVLAQIAVDKKNAKDAVNVVLIKKIGECVVRKMDLATLEGYLSCE